MKFICSAAIVLSLGISSVSAQEVVLYKQIDTIKLFLEVYYPDSLDSSKNYPAMVFFFGGGWISGNRTHFSHHAKYFSQRGLVCFLADYRIREKHGTTPFESLQDAKSAMRFIKENANQFSIDPTQVIAAGGSAGGHLAAATALVEGFNDDSDNLAVSPVPSALVLFNPVIDNGPAGYGFERIGSKYTEFSPLHIIQAGAPPTIFFLGTEDKLIPVETAAYFKMAMERLGSRCDLKLYEGEGHGFFNYRNFEMYRETVRAADAFLQSLGYLEADPKVKVD